MSFVRASRLPRSAANRAQIAMTAALGVAAIGLASCFTVADGVSPPLKQFYYPTGLIVSEGRTSLYVVNSDFDLQYSGGTVQILDLVGQDGREGLRTISRTLRTALNDEIAGAIKGGPNASDDPIGDACKVVGLSKNDNSTLYPGPCSPRAVDRFVSKSVEIGAFASTVALTYQPDPCANGKTRAARLFIPVRGDPSVTYIDVTDDREISCDGAAVPAADPRCGDDQSCLGCGAEANAGRCASSHLVGKDPSDSQRDLLLPVEPHGIDIDERGEAIVVAHQTEQTASLIVNHWGGEPALEYYLANISPGPTDIGSLPTPKLVADNIKAYEACKLAGNTNCKRIDYTPAFVVSYRSAAEFTLLRYQDDSGSQPPRPFLTRGLAAGIGVAASSIDSRGVAIDGTDRRLCEQSCGQSPSVSCLRTCAETHPLRVYMANRSPAALVIGRIETKFTEVQGPSGIEVTGAYEVPTFQDSVPLAFGASRVELGQVVDMDGKLSRRVFAAAFDSRFVFSYDPEQRRVDAIIRTGRGPHAIAFDTGQEQREDGTMQAYSTMYVAHFTDSYVGVVDLDMRNRSTFGQIYLTLGQPVPPKGSQ